MNEKNIFENNRAAWNQALAYHQKARKNSLQEGFKNAGYTTFDRDCDDVLIHALNQFDWDGKTIGQLPCNNGRELLSLMQLGAKEGVGFDIADAAIAEARQLVAIAGLNASFIRTNILDIDDRYNQYFDFIYISEGSLQWFPDLTQYFSVISRLLKPGANLLIFEMHPFSYFFEKGFDFEKQNDGDIVSYFEPGPHHYEDGLDYVGGVQYEGAECHWFMHKLSDILKALWQNGLTVTAFDEYNLEMANNPETKMLDKFPLSYILTGRKN